MRARISDRVRHSAVHPYDEGERMIPNLRPGGAANSVLLILTMAVIFILPVACGGEDEGSTDTGELVIYSGRSESLVEPILRRFEETTDIDVKVRYGSTSQLAATLLEEGSRSPADIFFAQDPGGLGAVFGLLQPISQDVLKLVPEWARSAEGKWIGTSGRARVVVYNPDRVQPADLPTGIEGFTAPEWKNRIGWPPTNGSFQAMVTGMRLVWGEARTQAWLEGIRANNPVIYASNTPIVQAVADGEIDVGFVNHYYLHRFLAEQGDGFSARNYYLPDGGPGSVVLVAGIGVIEQSYRAEEFIRFLLSAEGQQYFADETFEHPLIDGIATRPGIPPVGDLPKPEIDISDLGDLENTQAMLRAAGVLP
jgi:iron(III) transport system substrate-binding protein